MLRHGIDKSVVFIGFKSTDCRMNGRVGLIFTFVLSQQETLL
jgi:hypothetical protein